MYKKMSDISLDKYHQSTNLAKSLCYAIEKYARRGE